MKTIKLTLIALLAVVLYSCADSGKRVLPNSIGKPYELIVISTPTLWDSAVGDTVKSIFGKEIPMLNIVEPYYDVIHIDQSKMTTTLERHRNILKLVVDDKKYKVNSAHATFSENVEDQTVVAITSPSIDSMVYYLDHNGKLVMGLFDKSERDRFIKKAKAYGSENLKAVIESKFGFTMDIPSNYKVRNEKENFLWISYPLKFGDIGFTIYTFEPTSDTVNLLNARDEAVKNIPGPSDGSYMTTERLFDPVYSKMIINNHKWIEMRGFWKVQNDFMGGPYANFTTQDPVTGKMLGIDCYVQLSDTKESMRNYLRQLEALVLTLKFKEQ